MKMSVLKELRAGDEVFWTDPDEESSCSRTYCIRSITIRGEVVCITDADGSSIECFPSDLSDPFFADLGD